MPSPDFPRALTAAPWDAFSTHTPFQMSVAADSQWEQALILKAGDQSSRPDLKQWLANHGDDVATEIHFARDGQRQLFLGVRITGLCPEHQYQFLRTTRQQLTAGQLSPCLTALQAWRLPDGQPVMAPDPQPVFAEIGVLDAWLSVGSAKVWTSGTPLPDADALRLRLGSDPQLLAPHSQPIAVEMASNKPLPGWIGVVVATRNAAGKYSLDLAAAASVLSNFCLRQP